jgi:hypothetical protein
MASCYHDIRDRTLLPLVRQQVQGLNPPLPHRSPKPFPLTITRYTANQMNFTDYIIQTDAVQPANVAHPLLQQFYHVGRQPMTIANPGSIIPIQFVRMYINSMVTFTVHEYGQQSNVQVQPTDQLFANKGLPRDIELLVNEAYRRRANNTSVVPVPLLQATNELYESPVLYITWIIWFCLQLKYLDNSIANFINDYVEFLYDVNRQILQSMLYISQSGFIVPPICVSQDYLVAIAEINEDQTLVFENSNGQLELKKRPFRHASYARLENLIPNNEFCTSLHDVLFWCNNWLRITFANNKQYLTTDIRGKNFQISIFQIYFHFAVNYDAAIDVTVQLLEAIYATIQEGGFELDSKGYDVEILRKFNGLPQGRQSNFLNRIAILLHTTTILLISKSLNPIVMGNQNPIAVPQMAPTPLLETWLLSHIGQGKWNVNLQTISTTLSTWLQCNPGSDDGRILLQYLADISNAPQYQLWFTNQDIRTLGNTIIPLLRQDEGRDIPLLVNLSTTPRCLTLHFYVRGSIQIVNRRRSMDLNILEFHKRYHKSLSILDFLLLIEILHRCGGTDVNSYRSPLYLMNATWKPTNPNNSIRDEMENPFVSPSDLLDYINHISHVPPQIIAAFEAPTILTLESFRNVFDFLQQIRIPAVNANNISIQIPNLATQPNQFVTYIAADIQGTRFFPWINTITTSNDPRNPLQAYFTASVKQKHQYEQNDIMVRYLLQHPLYAPKLAKPIIKLHSKIELDLLTATLKPKQPHPPTTLFFPTNSLNWTHNYVRYFLLWLDISDKVAKNQEFATFISLLNDAYLPSNSPEQWSQKVKLYMLTTNHSLLQFKRLLLLYMTFYQGLLCPFMFDSIGANLQDRQYKKEKRILQATCKRLNLTNQCMLTLSYTVPGQFAIIGYHDDKIELFVTTLQAEDIIQGQGHPSTMLWSAIFKQTRGMVPINRITLYSTLTKEKAFTNNDVFWNNQVLPTKTSQSIMYPRIDPKSTQELIENTTEVEYMIATFFINEQKDGISLYKEIDQFSEHSIRNFLDLALCTSGQFIDKIRQRHRKRFPFRKNQTDQSSYNELCNELLASQNVTNHITIKASQIKPPLQYLDMNSRFNVNDDKAKAWLMKHYGFSPNEVDDINTHAFTTTSAESIVTHALNMKIVNRYSIETWFQKYVFRFMNDTLVTENFIRFMNDAYQLLKHVNDKIIDAALVEPNRKSPLLKTLFQSTRDEWERFLEHVASATWDKTPVRKLEVQLIYNEIHNASTDQNISELIRRQQSKIDNIMSVDKRVEAWILEETIVTGTKHYENIAILIIYNLFRLLTKYQLIQ